MTEEDKNEIRQIIRQELDSRFGNAILTTSFGVAACQHDWNLTEVAGVWQTVCKKCGAMTNTYGGSYFPSVTVSG